jgi:cytochrome d ubiquinol oxidase subunit II
MDLPLYSAAFAVFSIGAYALLDGFDLGVGALLLFQPDEAARNRMIAAIMPTWDGNETWLIMAAIAVFAAFPAAYGILLPAFYIPLVLMLLALGLRGVSFEFRYQVDKGRSAWDVLFAVGSVVAPLMQGLVVGGLLQGVRVKEGQFAGSVFDVFSLFDCSVAAAVLCGYCVLGAGWLHLKGTGAVREFAERALRWSTPGFAALAVVACIVARDVQPAVEAAWTTHTVVLSVTATLFCISCVALRWAIGRGSDSLPFLFGLLLFACGLVGLCVTVFPDLLPFRLTLWSVAAASSSQVFLLIGAAVVAPIVIAYSLFAYHVFRGKTPESGWES